MPNPWKTQKQEYYLKNKNIVHTAKHVSIESRTLKTFSQILCNIKNEQIIEELINH